MKNICCKYYKIAFLLIGAVPLVAFAQSNDLFDVLNTLKDLINVVAPLLMGVAVAIFLYGVVAFITAAGNEEKRKKAQGYIIWGLVGLFVMVAFWGIVQIIAKTFGVENQNINLPWNDINF
jgi:multisubunit Na+/H+ antiporter MnhB subunit